MDKVEIYTDGGCSGNPGPGGYGIVIKFPEEPSRTPELIAGGEPDTTNNRMELMGVIRALESLQTSCEGILYTDSAYVRNGIESWIYGWQKNGWKTSSGGAVKNRDLWERLLVLREKHDITFRWVKGHAKNVENNICDELAVTFYKENYLNQKEKTTDDVIKASLKRLADSSQNSKGLKLVKSSDEKAGAKPKTAAERIKELESRIEALEERIKQLEDR